MTEEAGPGPTLVLFDIDGTLVDTAGAGRRAMERAFVRIFRRDGVAQHARGVPFAGRTDQAIFRALAARLGLSAVAFDAEQERLCSAYLEELASEMARPDDRRRLLPGVENLLGRLAGHPGVHLGLLTGNLERGARLKLEPYGLNHFFADGGFGSDHADRREVACHARQKISRRLGIAFRSTEVVVVGDTEQDIDCGRANGYRAVAVATGWVSRAELAAAGPDALLDDFTDAEAALRAFGLAPPGPPRC